MSRNNQTQKAVEMSAQPYTSGAMILLPAAVQIRAFFQEKIRKCHDSERAFPKVTKIRTVGSLSIVLTCLPSTTIYIS